MAATNSPITMKICPKKGRCCETGRLEDPKSKDFYKGGIGYYDDDEIGGCYNFPMNDVEYVYFTVHGSDNWLGMNAYVYLSDVYYDCDISEIYGWIVNYETKKFYCRKQ